MKLKHLLISLASCLSMSCGAPAPLLTITNPRPASFTVKNLTKKKIAVSVPSLNPSQSKEAKLSEDLERALLLSCEHEIAQRGFSQSMISHADIILGFIMPDPSHVQISASGAGVKPEVLLQGIFKVPEAAQNRKALLKNIAGKAVWELFENLTRPK